MLASRSKAAAVTLRIGCKSSQEKFCMVAGTTASDAATDSLNEGKDVKGERDVAAVDSEDVGDSDIVAVTKGIGDGNVVVVETYDTVGSVSLEDHHPDPV